MAELWENLSEESLGMGGELLYLQHINNVDTAVVLVHESTLK
jgi:protein subunit release factor B